MASAENSKANIEATHEHHAAACPDSVMSFSAKETNAVRFDSLKRDEKETVNLITDTFGAGLNASQQGVFKSSIMDAMESRVGSLAKLAQPENAAAAKQFMEMMNNAGFDVHLGADKEGGATTNSLSIFEHGKAEGMRFNAVGDGSKSSVCYSPDPVERDKNGKNVRSTHDFSAVIDTQNALADRVKNYLDRE